MPIPRKIVEGKETESFDWSESFYSIVKERVKDIKVLMTDLSWKRTISRYFNVDMGFASKLFLQLIEDNQLLFVKKQGKHSVYINTNSPLENQLS